MAPVHSTSGPRRGRSREASRSVAADPADPRHSTERPTPGRPGDRGARTLTGPVEAPVGDQGDRNPSSRPEQPAGSNRAEGDGEAAGRSGWSMIHSTERVVSRPSGRPVLPYGRAASTPDSVTSRGGARGRSPRRAKSSSLRCRRRRAKTVTTPSRASWLAALLAPALIAALWGLFIAPRSRRKLPLPWRVAAELAVFAAACLALWSSLGALPAMILAAVVVTDTALLLLTGSYADAPGPEGHRAIARGVERKPPATARCDLRRWIRRLRGRPLPPRSQAREGAVTGRTMSSSRVFTSLRALRGAWVSGASCAVYLLGRPARPPAGADRQGRGSRHPVRRTMFPASSVDTG